MYLLQNNITHIATAVLELLDFCGYLKRIFLVFIFNVTLIIIVLNSDL